VSWLSPAEWRALVVSVEVDVLSAVLVAVPGIAIGWTLARCRFRGKALVDLLVHLPLVLPPVVVGWALLRLVGRRGPIGAPLHAAGIDIAFAFPGAVLAAAVMAMPLMVRPARLAIELVDRRLEDAAATLGAGRWRRFRRITLPLAGPGIAAGMVLAFARALGEFGATITLAGAIDGSTRTLATAMYAATQVPDGEASAARLALLCCAASAAALVASEALNRRLLARCGR
jgi:molybdate transport system permease protein